MCTSVSMRNMFLFENSKICNSSLTLLKYEFIVQNVLIFQCGLASHRRCLETLHWECGQGSRERRMTTFGVDFTAHIKETHTEIPHLIRKCTAEIDRRGLHVKVFQNVNNL